MAHSKFTFGEFTIDLARAALSHRGAAVALRPKCFALLEYLVGNAGRVIGKDELFAAVWPGVVVGDDSLTRGISDLRAALGDEAQVIVKTVPRRGYLFDAAVERVVDGERPPQAAAVAGAAAVVVDPDASTALSPQVRSRRVMVSVIAAATVIALAAVLLARPQALPAPRLSLVVLPFASSGNEAMSGPTAEVVTEDLTIALAKMHGLAVVGAGSALAFRGGTIDARKAGAELGVRYAVEGSLRRDGGRLRISVRLLDVQSAQDVWSEQFDVDRGERRQAEDEIVMRLANALDVALVSADSARTAVLDRSALDAEDLAVQCVSATRGSATESGVGVALCEEALAQDPRNVRALVRLAWLHADRLSRGQSIDIAGDLAAADGYATRALAVDPGHYSAHCAKAAVLEGQHRVPEAVLAAERCLALNPSDAGAYRMLAIQHFFLAQPEKTLEYAERGMHLGPRDPRLPAFLLFKGWACLQLGRNDEAVAWMGKARAASPGSSSIALALAVAQTMAGRDAEGRATMTAYLDMPQTRVRTLAQWDHRPDGNARFASFAAQTNEALLKAGLPP